MAGEQLQAVKVSMILCSCFFAYGTYWSDWAFDYYLLWANPADYPNAVSRATLYYANQLQAPNILKYIPFANLMIAAVGFSAGLANMTDGNILFDGASLAMNVISTSEDQKEITVSLKNIAAAHFIIVLAVTGIIGLQIAHFFVMKKTQKASKAATAGSSKKNN
ncbi:hypothetical protein EC973_006564 [Apophysomyces ossiformis]|uniref:ER membrane protein SH3 n=1 Tax=Apophysomyces ossiformis TaxID=679940 RepID=A0A8H7BVD0_9FUNG|nr:hypothetical protein EC973_006564 [Apophysomyces ossiformis]